ncbi:MAG: porin family protein [Pseudomonadales bacterium]|nr:porin family protein [Pseudomonadales bacterium]
MSKSSSMLAPLGLAMMLAFVTVAPAQAGGLYIGAGAYVADSDAGDDTVPGGFIGYNFLDTNFLMLSAEAGYYDLGNASNRKEKVDASAYTAGGVLAVPLFGPFFELYAKAGVAFADVKRENDNGKNTNNDEKAYYGVGASLDILDTIDIYVEYLVFDTNVNSDIAGVGIKFSF